jgi:hypothetical protein
LHAIRGGGRRGCGNRLLVGRGLLVILLLVLLGPAVGLTPAYAVGYRRPGSRCDGSAG